ncbi:uncharacterized protein TRUGW13939_05525 [Talaromyces rugulosus]|uniref:BZIP domain-containing protein n=1 Tax=Talaromyces rugulosus TaxID=121627 RepID=A0A7H8R0G0_TALRU|nr:uncharacterized protein TRUGW13939_05525 [Talaromyces rugulosus]QKX58403.1 hypothetical protein TRUGW13939_05525 [Talaromyces rugulosus]
MSAYIMLAEQSPLAAPAFTTADAVTAPASFDSSDFLGLGFNADEWNIGPLSPSFSSSWNNNSKLEAASAAAPFATVNFERDLKVSSTTAHVRNGQPTPPLEDSKNNITPPDAFSMANFSRNSWDDTPTPPSSDDRAGNPGGSFDYSSPTAGGFPKRRRLRGSHKPSIATTISSGADSDDQTPPHHPHEQRHERVKREKFLERNRLAASKCRQKKKEHTMQLESRFKEASDKRELLNAEISRLRSEVLGLKNEVLRHAQCGDEPIKLHLAQMVKQIANKDRDDPTATVPSTAAVAAAAAAAASGGGGGGTAGDGNGESLPDTALSPSSLRDSVSFGFDDPLHNMGGAESLEQQIRRDSEASIAMSADDDFNDLINV